MSERPRAAQAVFWVLIPLALTAAGLWTAARGLRPHAAIDAGAFRLRDAPASPRDEDSEAVSPLWAASDTFTRHGDASAKARSMMRRKAKVVALERAERSVWGRAVAWMR